MAIVNGNILLVEGEADRGFFEQVCKLLQIAPEIHVAAPRDFDPKSRNGKQAVLQQTTIILKQFADSEAGNQRHLAVVIDADYADERGLGFTETIRQFAEIVKQQGYEIDPINSNNGYIFKHTDGLPDIGLWIMPNNANDGMLEDWLKQSIHPDEQELFNYAQTIVSQLTPQKFKPIHQSKAEIATWLAWQKQPGHGLYWAIKDQLLDVKQPLYEALVNWLKLVYTPEINA